jgi:Fic family protein
LPALINGLTAFDRGAAQGLDAVLAAAVLAFGFVYIHPFEDGNGRLHRYLMHHVLAERGFNPPGLVFPVSAVILIGSETTGACWKAVLVASCRSLAGVHPTGVTSRS